MALKQTESKQVDSRIYDVAFLKALFDEMSQTYGLVNSLASFGFNAFWRKRCVSELNVLPNSVVYDLMTGMGEIIHVLAGRNIKPKLVVGVDLCQEMCRRAKENLESLPFRTRLMEENVLHSTLPPASADMLFCGFGLKTLSHEGMGKLAVEAFRLLKPGGHFSFLEISVPPMAIVRWPFLFYLRSIIPWIGKLLLGNPDNYRMLSVYTEAFGSCERAASLFREVGFNVTVKRYFLGCASALVGHKP